MPDRGKATATGRSDIEALLLEQQVVDEKQLERARRIVERLQRHKTVVEVLVELGQLARSEHERILRLHRSRLALPELLHEQGALDSAGLAAYREAKRAAPGSTDRAILVGDGLVTEEQYLRALCAQKDIAFVEPEAALVDRSLLDRTSVPYLVRQRVLPFRMVEGKLDVIMAEPFNLELVRELEGIYGVEIRPSCAPSEKIVEALRTIERFRESKAEDATTLQYRSLDAEGDEDADSEEAVRIVDYLLFRAIQMGASDLHIEPMAGKVRVRARVDGVLCHVTDLPPDATARVTSRVKVLAGADIAERRLHQDGRIFVKIEDREVDMRVSTYASVFGETIVLRLLDRKRGVIPLDGLGFESNVLSALRDVVLRGSSGLVLVTGPTGSGKTTTLYSFVDYVKDDETKVITCEDPVEYVMDGITQCSVNQKTGPTFADSLRAIVRQDPDVIVVGEIRDAVTASLGVESALTGHMVYATFHTEDSVGAIIRLLEMGAEPFLVASTVSCVVAQRLVRRLCDRCRKPSDPSKKDLRFLGVTREELKGMAILEGEGCEACGGSGYRGRTGIHEVLVPDDDFRDAVLRRAPSKELRVLARKLPGFFTLQEDGLLKVAHERTTLAEIADNVPRDTAARPLHELHEIASTRRFS